MQHTFASEYKWGIEEIEQMDMKTAMYHFRAIRHQKELQEVENITKMKLLIHIIHGQPEQMLETMNGIMGQGSTEGDDDIGEIEKQRSRNIGRR